MNTEKLNAMHNKMTYAYSNDTLTLIHYEDNVKPINKAITVEEVARISEIESQYEKENILRTVNVMKEFLYDEILKMRKSIELADVI
jgi:hypothetical protein